jgi:FkbM family methyltransferase
MAQSALFRIGSRVAKRFIPEPLALRPVWLTMESGVKVCCNSAATLVVFSEIFADQTYKTALDRAAKMDNVVDLGANRGLFVLYVEHYLRERKRNDKPRYVCVEPSQDNIDSLDRHMSENALADRVKVCAGVVAGTRDGTVDMFYDARANTSGGIGGKSLTTRKVPVLDLAKLTGDGPIDVLKMDVEGAEPGVLAEYADVLARTKVLVVELHLQIVDAAACRASIKSTGLELVGISSEQPHIITEIYERRA